MPRRPITPLVAAVALLVAVAIWLAYAYLALQPGARVVRPADAPIYIGLIGAGCLLDALVALACLRGRVGRVALTLSRDGRSFRRSASSSSRCPSTRSPSWP